MREREAFLELNDQNAKTWKRTIESDERKKTKTTNKIEIRLSGNEFAKERTESNAMRKERSKKKKQQRTENSSTRVIYNYEKKSTSKKK